MTVTAATPVLDAPDAGRSPRDRVLWGLIGAALVIILAHALGVLPDSLYRVPEALIPPAAEFLDRVFAFVQNDLGLIYVTRFIAEGPLEFLLDSDNREQMTWDYRGMKISMPCYKYGGRTIWGLSLMMLDELMDLVEGKNPARPRWRRR